MILYIQGQQMNTSLLWISGEGYAFMRKGPDVGGSASFPTFTILNTDTLLCTAVAILL